MREGEGKLIYAIHGNAESEKPLEIERERQKNDKKVQHKTKSTY